MFINFIQRYHSVTSELCAELSLIPCSPMDCNPLGFSVHGILQARILELVAFPSPADLPDPGIEPAYPALAS